MNEEKMIELLGKFVAAHEVTAQANTALVAQNRELLDKIDESLKQNQESIVLLARLTASNESRNTAELAKLAYEKKLYVQWTDEELAQMQENAKQREIWNHQAAVRIAAREQRYDDMDAEQAAERTKKRLAQQDLDKAKPALPEALPST